MRSIEALTNAAPPGLLQQDSKQTNHLFKYNFRKITPAEIQKIMQKNLLVWVAGYASGRAAGWGLIISLEQGSSFLQQYSATHPAY
jgi:hypothetical protein